MPGAVQSAFVCWSPQQWQRWTIATESHATSLRVTACPSCAEVKQMPGCRFEGEVLQQRANGQHLVAYDDGDEEWLHLSKEKFELLSSAGGLDRPIITKRAR